MKKNSVLWIVAALLLGLVAIETAFVHPHEPVAGWRAWPGFHFAFGLAACLVAVWLAKGLGRAWLQKPEERDDDV